MQRSGRDKSRPCRRGARLNGGVGRGGEDGGREAVAGNLLVRGVAGTYHSWHRWLGEYDADLVAQVIDRRAGAWHRGGPIYRAVHRRSRRGAGGGGEGDGERYAPFGDAYDRSDLSVDDGAF